VGQLLRQPNCSLSDFLSSFRRFFRVFFGAASLSIVDIMDMEPNALYYEKMRLRILYESKILLSNQNDSDYDRYTALCHRLFNVSSSNIILVDYTSIFVKSIAPGHNDMFSYPRSPSIAENYLDPDTADIVVIPDMTKYQSHSQVSQQKYSIQFLASVALVIEGIRIGFLSIVDNAPRYEFDRQQQMNLLDIGASVSLLISERRRSILNAYEMDSMRQELLLSHAHQQAYHQRARSVSQEEDNDDAEEEALFAELYPRDVENTLVSCIECNLYDYLETLKQLLQSICHPDEASSESQQQLCINYHLSDCCLQQKLHMTYPNAFLAVIIACVAHLRSIYQIDVVDIRLGYKKAHSSKNHRGLLPAYHRYQPVVDGYVKIEIHFQRDMINDAVSQEATAAPRETEISNIRKKLLLFDNLLQNSISKSNSSTSASDQSISTHDQKDFASYFDYLDDLLRDIHGSSRYTELKEEVLISDIYSEEARIAKGKNPPHMIVKDCFYDFSIPCLCKY
jgi:hypothetical protein